MKVFKTQLSFSGFDEGSFYLVDTIFYQNEWWLVSSWLEANDKSDKVPDKIVRLSGLRYQEVDGQRYRFLLSNSIPKSVFEGIAQEGYVVARFPVLEHIRVQTEIQ